MRIFFTLLFSSLITIISGYGQISLSTPDTVCTGTTVNFSTSPDAVTYTWDFSLISVVQPLSPLTSYYAFASGTPAWTTFDNDGGNYYSFVTDYYTGHVTRLSYGTNIYSTPVVTDLGSFSATGGNTEGIDIVKDSLTGMWYGLVVNFSQLVVLSFGTSLSSTPTSTVTTYSSIQWGHQVTIKRYGGSWIAFVANRNSNIIRFDFGSSLTSTPVVTDIPNVGSVSSPCNFCIYNQSGNWYMLVTSLITGTLSLYTFGSDLQNNEPTGTLLTAPAGTFNLPRPVNLLDDCNGNLIAYIANETGQLTKVDFGGDITSTPVFTSLGASGIADINSSAPCAYSDSFCFLLVNYSGSISKYHPLEFDASATINYYNPDQSYTFSVPGTYNITLFKDMGCPSGPSVSCKSLTVVPCTTPCLTDTLVINTGYDPVSGSAITPGANGAVPVTDPHWLVSSVSPDVASAIGMTPIIGLIEVAPGNAADVVTPVSGPWITNPPGNPGGWISCLNSNQYWDNSADTASWDMVLTRSFRMCSDDSITLTFYFADDNYISTSNLDGVFLFSQPSVMVPPTFSVYNSFTETVFLTSGTHTINIEVNNLAVSTGAQENPTGLDLYGTVSSATGSHSIVSESSAACNAYVCGGVILPDTVCNTLTVTADTLNTCTGSTDTISVTISGPDSVVSISWSPSAGLTDTTIANPSLTAGSSGWYYVTVASLIPGNLVFNGNFSLGDTGFSSSYSYVSGPGSLVPAGVYAITPDPHLDHSGAASFGDHTTGTGNMMAINGASTPISVWCATVSVTPNTNYDFSAWFANWSSDTTDNLPVIQFQINGVLLGTGPFTFPGTQGLWTQFNSTWNSGADTNITICIYDEQTAASGNDFAIDDISFQQLCIARDSVYIAAYIPDTTHTHADTSVCSTGSITLTAPGNYTNYLWSTGDTSATITAGGTGMYWVSGYSNCQTFSDSIRVLPQPQVSLGNDTTICTGDTLVLNAQQQGGETFLWNNSISNNTITVSSSGTYWVAAADSGCSASDSILITMLSAPVVNLGPDTILCEGQQYTLATNAEATNYMWSNDVTGQSEIVAQSGIYWLTASNQCGSSTDSVNITFEICDIFFPSAFTPNDDGLNDYAKVGGNLGFFTGFSLSIYNRFGQRVYYSQDIYGGWDGTFNGVKQDVGTYFYLIYYTLEGKQHLMKGDVSLIR